MPTRRVQVTNLSKQSTEESLREFFSFCGDIQIVQLEQDKMGEEKQVAIIVFETESGASTAVLLDNAVVDGMRIRVEGVADSKPASPIPGQGNVYSDAPGNTSPGKNIPPNSVLDEVLSETLNVATNIQRSAKQFDEQYEISNKVSTAAASVTSAAIAVDEKLHVRENANYVYENALKSATDLDQKYKISETVNNWMGSMFGWKSTNDLSASPQQQYQQQQSPSNQQQQSQYPSPAQNSADSLLMKSKTPSPKASPRKVQ